MAQEVFNILVEGQFEEPYFDSKMEFGLLSKLNKVSLGFLPKRRLILSVLVHEVIEFIDWPVLVKSLQVIGRDRLVI